MSRLLIAASGTGGHLFPALAVAEAVEANGPVLWLGVPDRLERSLVPERFGLITVKAGGLQGRGLKKLVQLIRLLWASVSVRRVILRESIDAVFTTGGYIAAPAILAARLMRCPLSTSSALPVAAQRGRLGAIDTQSRSTCAVHRRCHQHALRSEQEPDARVIW